MIVVDTHVLVWFIQADAKIGQNARARIERAATEGGILVPAICAWEVAFVERKGGARFPGGALAWIERVLALPNVRLAPLEPAIAVDSVRLAWLHKDPSDRMIVATARYLRAPLLTVDRTILDYAAAGHLEAIDARR